MPEPDYALIAYEAYAYHQHWKDGQGLPMPDWEHMPLDIQQAWEAAIDAAFNAQLPGDAP